MPKVAISKSNPPATSQQKVYEAYVDLLSCPSPERETEESPPSPSIWESAMQTTVTLANNDDM